MKRISILFALLLALVASACASGEATTPSPATPLPTPSATAEATPDAALPSLDFDGDPELAGRFPDTVAGEPLQIQSLDGDAFAATDPDPVFDGFLEAVGAEATDLSVAFGGALIGDRTLTAGAFRVRGAAEEDLEREFIATSQDAGDAPPMGQQTIGGKEVWTAVDERGATPIQIFVYADGDTLYFITGSLEHATELLEALP